MGDAALDKSCILRQGAEARLFKTNFLGRPTIIKERFQKKYRHPELDRKLRAKRTNTEVRCMLKCRKNGVETPVLYHVDQDQYRIYMQFIEGMTVRDFLNSIDLSDPKNGDTVSTLGKLIGEALQGMHVANVIHGDLTTSNMILKPAAPGGNALGTVVIIDFGLSYVSSMVEDKAVDLYVLERAFLSTHAHSQAMYDCVMNAYHQCHKGASKVLQRLIDVRARGRKKSMIG